MKFYEVRKISKFEKKNLINIFQLILLIIIIIKIVNFDLFKKKFTQNCHYTEFIKKI